jgi:cobyrinic acid a,c-diamide synthase
MLDAIRAFADSGRPLYAECGGLMYLSYGIETDGGFHPLAGVLPARTKMRSGKKALGYVEATLRRDSLWGDAGDKLRGHEFHYSELIDDPTTAPGWETLYTVQRRRSPKDEVEGFQCGSILASYLHLHLASRPAAIEHFIKQCGGKP